MGTQLSSVDHHSMAKNGTNPKMEQTVRCFKLPAHLISLSEDHHFHSSRGLRTNISLFKQFV